MTIDAIGMLETQYRAFAAAHGEATIRGDHIGANASYRSLVSIFEDLMTYGEDGRSVLIRLMGDSSPAVVCWAATHSLFFAESQALDALKSVAREKGLIGFGATMVLERWRKGELQVPRSS